MRCSKTMKGEAQKRYPSTNVNNLEIRGMLFSFPRVASPQRYPKRYPNDTQMVPQTQRLGASAIMSTSGASQPGKHYTNIQPMPLCC